MAGSLVIGIIPDPQNSPEWQQIKAYLNPAARLGGVPVLETGEEVWIVRSGGELMAAATARLTEDGHGEIVLCGGHAAKEWAASLADMICDWFKVEGMTAGRIYGRAGWKKMLPHWSPVDGAGRFMCLERRWDG